jgi:hypothetical protein
VSTRRKHIFPPVGKDLIVAGGRPTGFPIFSRDCERYQYFCYFYLDIYHDVLFLGRPHANDRSANLFSMREAGSNRLF